MTDNGVNNNRRRFLTNLTSGVGAAGAVVASVPFVLSMSPSERARAAGAPVEVDISKLEPGQMLIIEWRGKPVWIVHRTKDMLSTLASVESKVDDPKMEGKSEDQQPDYARNDHRSRKPEILVLVGICTHLGCSPKAKFQLGPASGVSNDWQGGFFCPCHGSMFDINGRVFKGVPAPTHLPVPPHKYLSDNLLLIGEDTEEGTA